MSDIDHPEPLSPESSAPGGPPPPGAASLLDVRTVASRLGLSTKAVRGVILRGELAAYKVAGRIRVDAKDLEDYLEAARVHPSPHDVVPPRHPRVPGGATQGLRPLLRADDAA